MLSSPFCASKSLPAISDLTPFYLGEGHDCPILLQGMGVAPVTNVLVAAHVSSGGDAWVLQGAPLQPEKSDNSGTTYLLTPTRPVSLNPFSLVQTPDHFEAVVGGLAQWLLTLLLPAPPRTAPLSSFSGSAQEDSEDPFVLTDAQMLDDALIRVWVQHGAQSGLPDILRALDERSPESAQVATRMRSKLSSLGLDWFKGAAALDVNAPHATVRVENFSSSEDGSLIAGTVLAWYAIAQYLKPFAQRKLLVIDGISLLGSSGEVAKLLTWALRSGRRYRGRLVIVSPALESAGVPVSPVAALVGTLCSQLLLLPSGASQTYAWMESQLVAVAPDVRASLLAEYREEAHPGFLWGALISMSEVATEMPPAFCSG